MHSCLYEGRLRHRRFAPVDNAFAYPLFMVYLDLAELPTVFADHPMWSVDRPNIARFDRRLHLGDAGRPLDACVRELVAEQSGVQLTGPIRLLTHLSYYGYGFNPVSFYYCFSSDEHLEAVVAEVNNTPWGEQHPYVLTGALDTGARRAKCYRFAKDFHVSPFMPMRQDYVWRFGVPADGLVVHMENHEDGRNLFDATLSLRRQEITRGALTRVLVRYPWMTAKVVAAIYWQALKLRWKKCPVYAHPKWTPQEAAA